MLIFKELQIELKEAEKRLDALGKDSLTFKQDQQWLDFLKSIDEYFKSFTWLRKKHNRQILRDFLYCGCNFRSTAEKYGISVEWMYKLASYTSELLEKRFYRVLEYVRARELAKAEHEFNLAVGNSDDWFQKVVREHYHPVFNSGVDLSACEDELGFLRNLYNIRDMVLSLDRGKLEHLLYLLNSDESQFAFVRSCLSQCLEGHQDVHGTLEAIKEHFFWQHPKLVGEV